MRAVIMSRNGITTLFISKSKKEEKINIYIFFLLFLNSKQKLVPIPLEKIYIQGINLVVDKNHF